MCIIVCACVHVAGRMCTCVRVSVRALAGARARGRTGGVLAAEDVEHPPRGGEAHAGPGGWRGPAEGHGEVGPLERYRVEPVQVPHEGRCGARAGARAGDRVRDEPR